MARFISVGAAVSMLAVWMLALPPRAQRLDADVAIDVPVRGAVHVHTRRSDGTGTVEDVAAAAARAGLRFVIVTDHGDGTRVPDPAAYHHGVLIVDAVEISTDGGHLVALDLPPAPYPLGGEARDVVEDVARLGGASIVAHPGSPRPGLRWVEWFARVDGLEWLNADSEWRDEGWGGLVTALFTYPFRQPETLAHLLDSPEGVLRRWDVLTQRRRVVALAAADAHARLGVRGASDASEGRIALPLPSYEALFRTFSVSLPGLSLTGEPRTDARAVIDAIRGGRVFSSIDALAAPARLLVSAQSGEHHAQAGDVLPIDGAAMLHVRTNAPPSARIVLIGNGRVHATGQGAVMEQMLPAQRGVYRVEVHLPGAPGSPPVPWVVSNPIYVGYPAREEHGPDPRGPARVLVPRASLGAFEWRVEHDARSSGLVEATAAGASAEFRYALSDVPSDARYAAFVMPSGTSLAAFDRLVFTARADAPMRLSVQLRTLERGDRWRRSVYLDEQPREVTVFFADTAPVGVTIDRRPALEEVGSVLFVVDGVHTPAGGSGRVRIEHLQYGR